MIRHFRVTGLHNRMDHVIQLNPDLNVLTGRNGTGKTTLLKLLWYMVSPNIERAVPEILFRESEVDTDEFRLRISRTGEKDQETVKLVYQQRDKDDFIVEVMAHEFNDPVGLERVEEINRKIAELPSGSVFFPTFRRIEGGFSIGERRHVMTYAQSISGNLSEVMTAYAQTMGVRKHRFIASISTDDVEQLLTHEYADISEKTNALHLELSRFISTKVGAGPRQQTDEMKEVAVDEIVRAYSMIDEIRAKVTDVNNKRAELMKSFDVLTALIVKIFKDKGITVSKSLTFGETKDAIRAGILSAGEKQMLSFLCYNAFTSGSPIFIDEPELSLHGDWQRLLFPTLLSQGTNNQFIVSTHSPFIYSKYPEKEILLHSDRGE
jgi:ABC-type lipoprotein export system ATPase subunit